MKQYAIQHAEKEYDDVSIIHAGFEYIIELYNNVLQEKPEMKNWEMDRYRVLLNQNLLKNHIRKTKE